MRQEWSTFSLSDDFRSAHHHRHCHSLSYPHHRSRTSSTSSDCIHHLLRVWLNRRSVWCNWEAEEDKGGLCVWVIRIIDFGCLSAIKRNRVHHIHIHAQEFESPYRDYLQSPLQVIHKHILCAQNNTINAKFSPHSLFKTTWNHRLTKHSREIQWNTSVTKRLKDFFVRSKMLVK